jgi:DNA-3-methyladenine glycosylase II
LEKPRVKILCMIFCMKILTRFIIFGSIFQNTLYQGYLLSARSKFLTSAVRLRSDPTIMSNIPVTKEMKTKRKRDKIEEITPTVVETVPNLQYDFASVDEERLKDVIRQAAAIPTTPGGWKVADGLKHLMSVDSRFKGLICKYGIPPFLPKERDPTTFDPFHSLLQSIISQQLATKVAESIHARVLAAYRNDDSNPTLVTPEEILEAKVEVSLVDGKRKIMINGVVSGLSESKAKYVESLAQHFVDEDKLKNKDFFAMPADELSRRLLAVKGLGPWSVDMFLIFHMVSPNILPLGDLIIRRGLCRFLGLSEEYAKTEKKMQSVAETHCAAWAPYRTLASLYMWQMIDELKKTETKTRVKRAKKSS